MNAGRIMIAAILAPLTAPIVALLLPFISGGKFWPYNDSAVFWIVLYSTAFGYLATLIVGFPGVYALQRIRRLNLPFLVVLGAVGGVAVFQLFLWVFAWLLGSSHSGQIDLTSLVAGSVLGMSVAFVFGLIGGVGWTSKKQNAV